MAKARHEVPAEMPWQGWITPDDEVIDTESSSHGAVALEEFGKETQRELHRIWKERHGLKTDDLFHLGTPLSAAAIRRKEQAVFKKWLDQAYRINLDLDQAIHVAEAHGWTRFATTESEVDDENMIWLEMGKRSRKRVVQIMKKFFRALDGAEVWDEEGDWKWWRE